MILVLEQDPVQTMHALMEVVYQPVFKIARDYNIPIIDLPNTFDINDSGLYEHQIEPSYRGGKIITSLIKHVVENHDWQGKHSPHHPSPPPFCLCLDQRPRCDPLSFFPFASPSYWENSFRVGSVPRL